MYQQMYSQVKYRIAWIVKETEITGNGGYCLSFDDARNLIQSLNKKHLDAIHYWIEAMPLASEPLASEPLASLPLLEVQSHLPQ